MSLLKVEAATKRFEGMDRCALKDVSCELNAGEALGVVGASGSGKSTLARAIVGLERLDGGFVQVGSYIMSAHDKGVGMFGKRTGAFGRDAGAHNKSVGVYGKAARCEACRVVQMVFQDHTRSFDPFWPVGTSLVEAGCSLGLSKSQARKRAAELFERVELPRSYLSRRSRELSGGQRQRAAIARALMGTPQLLILDEVTSALDVLTQMHILELLRSLMPRVALVFISHDIALVHSLCSQMIVLDAGRVVEQGSTHDIVSCPQHPTTRLLLASVP